MRRWVFFSKDLFQTKSLLRFSGSLKHLLFWVQCLRQAGSPGARGRTTCFFSFLSVYQELSSIFLPQSQMLRLWGVVWSEAGKGGCSSVPSESEMRVESPTSGIVLPLTLISPIHEEQGTCKTFSLEMQLTFM